MLPGKGHLICSVFSAMMLFYLVIVLFSISKAMLTGLWFTFITDLALSLFALLAHIVNTIG